MIQIEDRAGRPASAQQADGLEVRIVRELLEQAKAERVSLVGPGGLLARVTKTMLQAALEPRWPITWVMRKASRR